MSWLARFESACAAFIERAFARSFPSELAPAHVARKLIAAMEAQTRREDGELVAPGSYAVYVNPEELERLSAERDYLEREWAELLRELAGRVGAVVRGGDPQVRLLAADDVPVGAAEIEVGDGQTPPRRRGYELRVTKGVSPNPSYPVAGRLSIGRGKGVSIALVDASVSRRHAVVELIEGVPVVRDLGSTNGTFVNGERVQSRSLRPGDVLKLGNTEMRVEVAV